MEISFSKTKKIGERTKHALTQGRLVSDYSR
jgi:hypothetical protein